MAKGVVLIQSDSCKGCGLCVQACPRQILELDKTVINARGVYPAKAAREGCVGCASCAVMCPDGAITIQKEVEG